MKEHSYEEKKRLENEKGAKINVLIAEKEAALEAGYASDNDKKISDNEFQARYIELVNRYNFLMREAFPYEFRSEVEYVNYIQKSPKQEWIKPRKIGEQGESHYVPIAIQQAIGDKVFSFINILSTKVQQIGDDMLSIVIEMNYKPSYPNAPEDGYIVTGAASAKIPKKAHEAFIPKVLSCAKSNAFESVGNVFGRNIKRDYVEVDFHL